MSTSAIARIWSELFDRDILANENFFTCGGNSILAVELANKIRLQLDVDISHIDIFKYPTINKLNKLLGKRLGRVSKSGMPAYYSSVHEAPISSVQRDFYFLEVFKRNGIKSRPRTFTFKGDIDEKTAKIAFQRVCYFNPILISPFDLRGERVYQLVERKKPKGAVLNILIFVRVTKITSIKFIKNYMKRALIYMKVFFVNYILSDCLLV